jgi:hypothetical protein
MENPNLCTICSEFTYDQQNEHNIKVRQIFCQKKQNKLKTKTSVVFVSRKTGQINSSCTHYKPYSNGVASKSSGRSTYTNRLIRALLAWILYGLIIFQLILIIDIQIATNQYLNL